MIRKTHISARGDSNMMRHLERRRRRMSWTASSSPSDSKESFEEYNVALLPSIFSDTTGQSVMMVSDLSDGEPWALRSSTDSNSYSGVLIVTGLPDALNVSSRAST